MEEYKEKARTRARERDIAMFSLLHKHGKCRKRATNYRTLLREMTHKHEESYGDIAMFSLLHKHGKCNEKNAILEIVSKNQYVYTFLLGERERVKESAHRRGSTGDFKKNV